MSLNAGGDDLDDDFVLDDTVALSDGEGQDLAYFSDDQSTTVTVFTAPHSPAKPAEDPKKRKQRQNDVETKSKSKKRKLTDLVPPPYPSGVDASAEPARSPSQDVPSYEVSVAAQLPHKLSSYLASVQAKTFTKLSTIERDDLHIPETSIVDTTAWSKPRTLDNLVEFITTILPTLHTRLGQKSKANGAPTLLFIAGAALRVADVTRVLKSSKLRGEKGGEVAKLFSKHIKLPEHVAYLRKTKVGAAVGTPGRIGKLLAEPEGLAVSALTHIILDMTFEDAKKRTLLDIPETRDEVFKSILGEERILKAVKEGKIQVVLF